MSPTPAEAGRRRVPRWVWIVLAAAVLAIVAIIIILGLQPAGGGPAASPSPGASSASPGPSSTPTATPAAQPTGAGTDEGTFDSALPAYLSDVLNSQNTAVLAQGGTFSDPVLVLAANSGLNQNMTPEDAVGSMGFMFTPSDPNPWDLALPESVLETYRAGPYGDHFPAGAIVARSYDGHVFSFVGHDSVIAEMFMAGSEDLLTF